MSVHPSEPPRCAMCASAHLEPAFTAEDRNLRVSDRRFAYVRCGACGSLACVDPPEDLGRYYPEAYYEMGSGAALERAIVAEQPKLELLHEVSRPPGRLVEIGPGAGGFAAAARRDGFRVTGLEMDARACEHLRTTIGVDAVQTSAPHEVLPTLEASDAVVLWHVLEHVEAPGDLIDAAAANLAPGGALVVATPNPGSLQLRVLRDRWAHVDAPRHLNLLSAGGLRRRAGAAGLRTRRIAYSDPAGRHWNYFGWEHALRRRSDRAGRLSHAAGLAVTLALRPVEERRGRGSAYTALFTKDT